MENLLTSLYAMIHLFLVCALFPWSPVVPVVDSVDHQPVLNIAMDSLDISPLPKILDFQIGDVPVEVLFEEALLDQKTRFLSVRGMISDQREKVEIPGARVIIGSYDTSMADAPFFTPRTSVMTNHRGQFKLAARITQSDVLIIVWLGYLEKCYSLRKIVK
jgi:hypothetical protein